MPKWYEYTIGVYVEANTEQEAFEKLQPTLKAAHEVDVEGDEQVEMVGEHPKGGAEIR